MSMSVGVVEGSEGSGRVIERGIGCWYMSGFASAGEAG